MAIVQVPVNIPDEFMTKISTGEYELFGVEVRNNKMRVVKIVVNFNEALKVYLNAVRKGALTMEIISDVMRHLGELKMQPNFEKINIALPMEELDVLLNQIFENTKKLASENAIELTSLEKETPSQTVNPIINLQRCLETQKRIFELAS